MVRPASRRCRKRVVEIDKNWCVNMAKLEGDAEIGAGLLALDPQMNICTELQPNGQWTAIDADSYDGAPDAGRAGSMGWGKTEQEAIADLLEKLAE